VLGAELDIPLLSRAGRLIGDLQHARRYYRVGWGFLLKRFFVSLRRRGLHQRAAISAGLLDPRISEEALGVTVPKNRLTQLQRRVNPIAFVPLTEEKIIFYAYCAARKLPVPRFFGFTAKPAGYSADGSPLAKPEDWRAFAAALPDEFIVKPSHGVYGRGVRVFRREDSGFLDDTGRRWEPGELGRATITHPDYDSFVIQERLHNHPDLVRLSGSSHLQTIRIVSWIRDSGEVVVPRAALKVITGDSVVDNLDHGHSGNLLALIDVRTGVIEAGVGPGAAGEPVGVHPTHPRTGIRFDGFRLPLWEDVCSFVRSAAVLFAPLRTIGWDVAITASGPVLVEGNAFWDPSNWTAHSRRKEVIEPFSAFLRELDTASLRPGN